MKKLRIWLSVICVLLFLSGCEKPLYQVKLEEQEKDELTQIAQKYLLERFGDKIAQVENCYVNVVYSDRREAEKKKNEWNVCVYGTGENETVYNVIIHYADRSIISYSARYTNGMHISSMDDDDRNPVKENRTKAATELGLSEDSEMIRSVVSAMNTIKAYGTVDRVQKMISDKEMYLKVVYGDTSYGILLNEENYAVGIKNLEDDTWLVKPTE